MTLVVAGVIADSLTAPARVVACRRIRPAALAGQWEFPGGKCEAGETPQDALRRELREELRVGVTLGPEIVAPGGTWRIDDRLSLRVWWATTPDVIMVGESHDQWRWVGLMDLGRLAWLPVDAAVVAHLQSEANPRLSRPIAPGESRSRGIGSSRPQVG